MKYIEKTNKKSATAVKQIVFPETPKNIEKLVLWAPRGSQSGGTGPRSDFEKKREVRFFIFFRRRRGGHLAIEPFMESLNL